MTKEEQYIEQANPATESRQLANGSILANTTILRHLEEAGMSLHTIGSLMPARPDARPEYLGTLYGETIYVDHVGRLKFGVEDTFRDGVVDELTFHAAEAIEVGQMVAIIEPACEHGFVVRDVVGDNRFLCKECNVRFPRHPSMISKTLTFNSPSVSIANNLHTTAILTEFHDGMITFSEAAQATRFSLAEMKKAMEELFPPETEYELVRELGRIHPRVITLNEGPKRVSCFKEVEDIFSNPKVTFEDFNKVLTTGIFPDLLSIDQYEDIAGRGLILTLNFTNDSKQRIELWE